MSKTYSIAEARSRLSEIVNRAEAGKATELTRRGKKVAVVVSAQDFERFSGKQPTFSELFDRFRKRFPLEDVYGEPFTTGVRDKSPGRKVRF
jgi:prevent-host-death family protein